MVTSVRIQVVAERSRRTAHVTQTAHVTHVTDITRAPGCQVGSVPGYGTALLGFSATRCLEETGDQQARGKTAAQKERRIAPRKLVHVARDLIDAVSFQKTSRTFDLIGNAAHVGPQHRVLTLAQITAAQCAGYRPQVLCRALLGAFCSATRALAGPVGEITTGFLRISEQPVPLIASIWL